SKVPPMPYEEVRDFFYARHNHVEELDALAERIADEEALAPGDARAAVTARLARVHGVRVAVARDGEASRVHRTYDAASRVLRLSAHLGEGQMAFEIATQLAFLEAGSLLESLSSGTAFSTREARALARIGLASYFAGALVLPYARFFEAAEAERYDIERLGLRFGVGFETVCHRLSTLQRPTMRGVPFFFVRVDRAGNISKRQSATAFHFSRIGGTCPLWNLYEAFAQPGRILTQLAEMPDGRTYLWIARTVSSTRGGYGAPSKTFAVGLGCDARDAHRLVYSKGMDLRDRAAATPIGGGCKVCEREGCAQRAFPPIGRRLAVDENERRFVPYPVES
ncbi:ImmA/IrrE family metallo-endopeptidase, partial [bacterium]